MPLPPKNLPYEIGPLLNLEIALFRLPFRAEKNLRPLDVVPAFRSLLGVTLKKRFCPFPDYEKRSCEGCDRASTCCYTMLFAPTCKTIENKGKGRFHADLPRPYTLAMPLPHENETVQQGKEGGLVLTLIGAEAIRFKRPMLESLSHAAMILRKKLSITPLPWQTFEPGKGGDSTGFSIMEEGDILGRSPGAPLSCWISALPVLEHFTENFGGDRLELRFITPLQLKRMQNKFMFIPFLQSVIARLRDLKRIYQPEDNDMGNFSMAFYKEAEKIITKSSLISEKASWFSKHRNKTISLEGLTGKLILKGEVSAFIPLFAAAFFLGIGSKTVYGLGRFDLQGWEDSYDNMIPQKSVGTFPGTHAHFPD